MKVKSLRDIREIIREEMVMHSSIADVLREGSKTVPEVVKELNYPTDEVMFWMMGMRKYGYIHEAEEITEEGFYKYSLTEKGREKNGA